MKMSYSVPTMTYSTCFGWIEKGKSIEWPRDRGWCLYNLYRCVRKPPSPTSPLPISQQQRRRLVILASRSALFSNISTFTPLTLRAGGEFERIAVATTGCRRSP